MKIQITNELLSKLYDEHKSIRKVAKLLDSNYGTIRNYMEQYNIHRDYRQAIIDKDIFNNDTEIVFYIAGFIAADGCIRELHSKIHNIINYKLKLEIQQNDIVLLEKIRDFISPDINIYKYERINKNAKYYGHISKACRFEITSRVIIEGLFRFGITPKKSLTLHFPEWLSKHPLVHHFIRGYFDGDGSVCFRSKVGKNRNTKQRMVHFCGTEQFLHTINQILSVNCSAIIPNKQILKNRNIYSLYYCGNNITTQISNYLYKDATIYLERKYNLFQQINQ
jgi:hypothetical protein